MAELPAITQPFNQAYGVTVPPKQSNIDVSNPLKALQTGGQAIANLDDGWYVFIAVLVGILTANTRAGLIVTGILGLALLYQFNLLIQGK